MMTPRSLRPLIRFRNHVKRHTAAEAGGVIRIDVVTTVRARSWREPPTTVVAPYHGHVQTMSRYLAVAIVWPLEHA